MSELSDQYARDGAVVLRNVLSPSEVETLRSGIDANLAQPSPRAITASRSDDPGYFTVRLHHDHMLTKQPATRQKTPWQQHQPYYNIEG